MSQLPKLAEHVKPQGPRHGRTGWVRLQVDVPPATKNRLVLQAVHRGGTVTGLVNEIIDAYYQQVDAR